METILVTNAGFGTGTGKLLQKTEGGKVIAAVGDSIYAEIVLTTTQGILRTPLMYREAIKIAKIVPVTGQVQISTFTPTGAFTDGGIAGVTITAGVEGIPLVDNRFETFEVAVMAGMSVANVLTAITAKINESSDYVTATTTATVMTITGKTVKNPFFVNGTYGFKTYATAVTQAYIAPVNSGEQIYNQEDIESAHKGNQHSLTYGKELYSQNMQADVSKKYITYDLTFKNPKNDILQGQGEPYLQTVRLAFESTLTVADIETALKLLNANTGL